MWVHFTPSDPARFVSAADVLTGAVDPQRFERKLVLVGVTAVGLGDRHATPVAPRMAGVEIHAQLLEGIFDGALLTRPRWARWVEAALLALGGGVLILAVPAWPVGRAALLALAVLGATLGLGFLVYRQGGLLLDVAGPALGIALTYGAMLGDHAHRSPAAAPRPAPSARGRAGGGGPGGRASCRPRGRIQMGILPAPATVLRGDDRIALYAFLEPARIVGGDLYDFFRLDGDRLFFLVGDVSGHGVAGSLFMAVSKALCKSAALRSDDLGAMMRESNAEISRDNPEALFVTVWAGLLDARTGRLEYCNAGHEPAWLLGPRRTDDPAARRGRGAAALRDRRLSLRHGVVRDASGRDPLPGDGRRDRGLQHGRRAVQPHEAGGGARGRVHRRPPSARWARRSVRTWRASPPAPNRPTT